MSNKTITAIMVGIFNIVMFICGTVLFAFNNFNGLIYEPYIHTLHLQCGLYRLSILL